MAVDYDFISTMGIQILKGRDFSREFGSDMTGSVILNEKAVKDLGITDPLGKLIGGQTIIGIVQGFQPSFIAQRYSSPYHINDRRIHTTGICTL